jgi:phage shock protein PspC (stress-responsive transcriptional regulator)
MQKVVHVSLHGNAFVLEEGGYEALRAYLDGAAAKLAADPDQEEILGDLEQAIGEKCQRHVAPHKSVVTAAEMARILAEMGPVGAAAEVGPDAPPPPDGQDGAAGTKPAEGAPPPAGPPPAPPSRRLYRILEGGVLGGLCNGIGAYAGVDANVVRAIFVILALVTHGAWLLVYVVLLFVVPAAGTAEERAAARGLPFSAQGLIDEAKRQYARLEKELPSWAHVKSGWRREELRERRRARREHRRWREAWRAAPPPPVAGAPAAAPPPFTYGEQLASGFVVPIFAMLSAAFTVAWVTASASLVQAGRILGWTPGLPLWGGLLLLFVLFLVLSQPIGFARRAYHRDARGGWVLAAWDGVLWLGFLLVFSWAAWRLSPELRAFVTDLPGALQKLLASLPRNLNVER